MIIMAWIIILVVCLVVLVKSADYFVHYSEKIGLALGLSSFVIGATIVAIGTSAPELVSSLFAVLDAGATEFVADNVIGSNIANAMLILGVGALFARQIKVQTSLIDVDLPFFFASMALFVYFAWDGEISRWEGVMLLMFFFIFIIYSTKEGEDAGAKHEDKEELADLKNQFKNGSKLSYLKYVIYIVISVLFLVLSAKYLIESILSLSVLLGISSSMLTITVVALGTSLPEIITSVSAIKRGNHGIAIGNVFGSNTLNIALVAGLPAIFTNLKVADSTLIIGLPFLIIATFMAIFVTFDDKIRFWEGVSIVFLYMVFILKITHLI